MRAGILPSTSFMRESAMALWFWVPTAYTVFVIGFVLSATAFTRGRPVKIEDAVMSDLLMRCDNPSGYLPAALATGFCAVLLLPVAGMLEAAACQRCRLWRRMAANLYRIGLLAVLLAALSAPLDEGYARFRVALAILAFMSLAAALAMVSLSSAVCSASGRPLLAWSGVVEVAVLLLFTYVCFDPAYFAGRRWLLALLQWGSVALFAYGTLVILARDAIRARLPPTDSGDVE